MSIWRLKTVSCGKRSNAKRYTQDREKSQHSVLIRAVDQRQHLGAWPSGRGPILMLGVAPHLRQRTWPSLGGEAGGRSPGFIFLYPSVSSAPFYVAMCDGELLFVEAAIDLDGTRDLEQIREPPRGFGPIVRRKFPELGARSLMQDRCSQSSLA
jgi:hypothetical protein